MEAKSSPDETELQDNYEHLSEDFSDCKCSS